MSEKPRALRLSAPNRLKNKRDFEQIRAGGQRAILGCLIANWRVLENTSRSRVGVIASAKIGNAPERNRAKRLMREVFRLHQHEFAKPLELVLVARQSIAGKTFAEVENTFLTILRKAGVLT